MQKTILITGSTDGIGLETAKILLSQGHHVLLHGRNPEKLQNVEKMLSKQSSNGKISAYLADLSSMSDVETLAEEIIKHHSKLDVLINNAGILHSANTITQDGLDIRFAVNTVAPYLLTQKLMPLLNASARVINLSSAAQSSVDINALLGKVNLTEMEAYSQSKLAITMWSRNMALMHKNQDLVVVSVNPGSMLGSKMVKEGFGVAGRDMSIGADILVRAALADEFATASGQYFDNDSGQFATPHPDALNAQKSDEVEQTIQSILEGLAQKGT